MGDMRTCVSVARKAIVRTRHCSVLMFVYHLKFKIQIINLLCCSHHPILPNCVYKHWMFAVNHIHALTVIIKIIYEDLSKSKNLNPTEFTDQYTVVVADSTSLFRWVFQTPNVIMLTPFLFLIHFANILYVISIQIIIFS